jgi:hypothetical protein
MVVIVCSPRADYQETVLVVIPGCQEAAEMPTHVSP